MSVIKILAFVGLLSMFHVAYPSDETSGTRTCTSIDASPYTIQAPGCYVLKKDLSVKDPSAIGISITSDNVLLDLNGHIIVGTRDQKASGVGIYAQGVKNVQVENGTVAGFLYGVRVDLGSSPKKTEDFGLRHLTLSDNSFRGAAIQGKNTVIEHNEVLNTGGTHFFPDAFSMGIEVAGNNCVIRENRIAETHAVGVGEGVAISLTEATRGCTVHSNTLSNSAAQSIARTFGIWVGGTDSRGVKILENRIKGFTYAFAITRLPSDLTRVAPAIYERNISLNTSCSPVSLPTYYKGLSRTNKFENNPSTCEDTISERAKYMKKKGTGQAAFRLAQAMLACDTCSSPEGTDHLIQMQNGLYLLRLAAEMGVQEAERVLPGAFAFTASVKRKIDGSANATHVATFKPN